MNYDPPAGASWPRPSHGTRVKHKGGFCLNIQFNDGNAREVDLSAFMKSPPPVFQPLQDEKAFAKISVSPVGGIAWDCGAELSAEYLKDYPSTK
ncbi:MAG: DUF2442 domain-containing protein [Proteobacteria bacterium]|nr:DUF2442 domain-containing protein [Pseudomonadota bacterium]